MPKKVWERVFQYLQAIDKSGRGYAIWMDFYRIAGNETNLNRAVGKMRDEYHFIAVVNVGNEVRYSMTQLGTEVYQLMKKNEYLGPFFEEAGRPRFRSYL